MCLPMSVLRIRYRGDTDWMEFGPTGDGFDTSDSSLAEFRRHNGENDGDIKTGG